MATCRIYSTSGVEIATVVYKSSPPDTEATIASFGRVVGSLKSHHAERLGEIYDNAGNLVGSTEGFAPYGERESFAERPKGHTIGLVKNGSEILKYVGESPQFTWVGTVKSDPWTLDDKEGLRRTSEAMGHVANSFVENLMQIKQRSLAGDAILILNLL